MAIEASSVRGWALPPPESEIESILEHPAPISVLSTTKTAPVSWVVMW
ncbi:MAG: hypothetical protein WB869_00345 [Candidatus Acidiferrales bacterium]